MGRRWTDEDVTALKILAQLHPAPRIAEIMDRSVGGVVFKAHKLKLPLKRTRDQGRMQASDPGPAGFDWPR
jgi:hypothetical protein